MELICKMTIDSLFKENRSVTWFNTGLAYPVTSVAKMLNDFLAITMAKMINDIWPQCGQGGKIQLADLTPAMY